MHGLDLPQRHAGDVDRAEGAQADGAVRPDQVLAANLLQPRNWARARLTCGLRRMLLRCRRIASWAWSSVKPRHGHAAVAEPQADRSFRRHRVGPRDRLIGQGVRHVDEQHFQRLDVIGRPGDHAHESMNRMSGGATV